MKKVDIHVAFPWELPDKMTGPGVVIDVNCASHNIAYLLTQTEKLYLATQNNADFALSEIPESVIIGESDDINIQKKFISDNDAVSIVNTNVNNKKVILLTFNGTQTIYEALEKGANPVIAASYPNLHIVCNWLIEQNFPEITLIPAGGREKMYSPNHNLLEDLLCAESMKSYLTGKKPDFEDVFSKSQEFIKLNSRDNNFNYDKRFKLIFTPTDSYPVIPICRKLPNGLIKVNNYIESI
jgi:phosphosulfolactate phosphohydrolase-like enzyme